MTLTDRVPGAETSPSTSVTVTVMLSKMLSVPEVACVSLASSV